MPLEKPKKDEWVSPWKGKPRPDYPAAANSRPDMYANAGPAGMMNEAKKLGPALMEGAATSPMGVGSSLLKIGDTAARMMSMMGGPDVPDVPGVNAPMNKPGANDGIAEETAQPQAPNAAPTVGENIPEDVLTVGSPYGMSGTLYANATPPAGSGNMIYSDSKAGATNVEGGGGFMRLLNPGKGPFGRTLENQNQINQNVAAYERASGIYQGMNQDAERKRLESRASGSVNLNQGLGGFLNDSANRNFARKRLLQNEKGDAAQASAAADRDLKVAIEGAKLNKPNFQSVSIPYGEVDPITGKQPTRDILMDPMTGQQVDPLNPQGGQATADSSTGNFDAARQSFIEQLKSSGGTREAADALLKRFTEEYQPTPAELAELKELIRGAK